jgi:hypothetical protein
MARDTSLGVKEGAKDAELVSLLCILLTAFPAFGQSTSKYQVGTITEVKVHQTAGNGSRCSIGRYPQRDFDQRLTNCETVRGSRDFSA